MLPSVLFCSFSLLTNWCLFFCRLLCASLPRSFHMCWLWLSLLTHTQILHNPKAVCTQPPTHTDQLQQSQSQTYSNPRSSSPQTQTQFLKPVKTHIVTSLLPPLLLFPTPPLYIPLELPSTPLLAAARNTTTLLLSYWIVYTGQKSTWWPQDKMYGIYLPHHSFGHIHLIIMMIPTSSSSIICKSMALYWSQSQLSFEPRRCWPAEMLPE